MNHQAFSIFASHLYRSAGLVLHETQSYLIEARLTPLLQQHSCRDLDSLALALDLKHDESLLRQITEAMVTHETSFMRDAKIYAYFDQTILPFLIKKNAASKKLRIWSAGCSSGQEPYSIAMLLAQKKELLAGWEVDILATDLSHDIMRQAKEGLYSQFDVQRGLSIRMLLHHFDQENDHWRVKDDIRNMITFRQGNLLEKSGAYGSFDMIFCRNVLIYVDQKTKFDFLRHFHRVMRHDGYLLLGGVETLMGLPDYWVNRDPIACLYRPIAV